MTTRRQFLAATAVSAGIAVLPLHAFAVDAPARC